MVPSKGHRYSIGQVSKRRFQLLLSRHYRVLGILQGNQLMVHQLGGHRVVLGKVNVTVRILLLLQQVAGIHPEIGPGLVHGCQVETFVEVVQHLPLMYVVPSVKLIEVIYPVTCA